MIQKKGEKIKIFVESCKIMCCAKHIKHKEIKEQEKILENLYQFYKNLFSDDVPVPNKNISNYVKDIDLSKLSMEQRELFEGGLTKKQVIDALNKMENKKRSSNDGLTEEFSENRKQIQKIDL